MKKTKLLCLHGALGCAQQLETALQPLQEKYTLHFLDFPGHGKKANQWLTIENCVAATRDFIRENNLAGAPILGYSMGGYVALLLAKQNPELVGQLVTLGTKLAWSPEMAAAETKKLNPKVIAEKVPHYAKMLESWHGAAWPIVLENTAQLMRDLGENPRLHEDVYQTILHPVLLLLAENDTMVSVAETQHAANFLPFGEFQKLANSAHPIEKVAIDLLEKNIRHFVA